MPRRSPYYLGFESEPGRYRPRSPPLRALHYENSDSSPADARDFDCANNVLMDNFDSRPLTDPQTTSRPQDPTMASHKRRQSIATKSLDHLNIGNKIEWLAALDTAYAPEHNYRRSSIICTIGPKTNSVEAINKVRFAPPPLVYYSHSHTRIAASCWSQCRPHELFPRLLRYGFLGTPESQIDFKNANTMTT